MTLLGASPPKAKNLAIILDYFSLSWTQLVNKSLRFHIFSISQNCYCSQIFFIASFPIQKHVISHPPIQMILYLTFLVMVFVIFKLFSTFFSPQGKFCIQTKTLASLFVLLSPPLCTSLVLARWVFLNFSDDSRLFKPPRLESCCLECPCFCSLHGFTWRVVGHLVIFKDSTVSASLLSLLTIFTPFSFAPLLDPGQASVTAAIILSTIRVGLSPYQIEG